MEKFQNYISTLSIFNTHLKKSQNLMLGLNKSKSFNEFNKLFRLYREDIKNFKKQFEGAQRPGKDYLILNQCRLMINFLNKLEKENKNLPEKNEAEIITYFEQQFRFKKIVIKHVQTIKSLNI